MQAKSSVGCTENRSKEVKKDEELKVLETTDLDGESADHESVIDISGKCLDLSVLEGREHESVEGFYMYRNVFSLIPRAVGVIGSLKRLKFFSNEINLFPAELRNLVQLECLQVKVSSPVLSGLDLNKLQGLKELEFSIVPPRSSGFPLLSEIAGFKSLTKLSVCHFSIRYLPPEIGCLKKLEFLDLSFNKIRNLPTEITYLIALISLKVATNKLAELPSGFCSLQSLEILDLSHNRLISLEGLELDSMHNLQRVNLQHNKLVTCCQIPSWICCNWEGNGIDISKDKFFSSPVEMDVQEIQGIPQNGGSIVSSSHSTVPMPTRRCFSRRRSSRGWKRRYYLQQRAHQERLNTSRKSKNGSNSESSTQDAAENCKRCKHIISEDPSDNLLPSEAACKSSVTSYEKDGICSKKDNNVGKCSCATIDSVEICGEKEDDSGECDSLLDSLSTAADAQDEDSSSEIHCCKLKSKRQHEEYLDNPKPSKSRRPINDCSDISLKYSNLSFCGIEDCIPDGFYDAGRDRPFLPLEYYEQNLHLDSREVILVDRERDEGLDAIVLSAQALVNQFKQIDGSSQGRRHATMDDLQIASLLALFLSDHFGGGDRNAFIERTRKSVSGSNYRKPFVCTCSTGNSDSTVKLPKQNLESVEDVIFHDLCEKSIQSIKTRKNSILVPIGTLQFGVCRHRALLMKYLCDRLQPQILCELVRGYLDFSPHAWNVIIIKRGDSFVRMVVDACHPHDIREETDPEIFCRYVPLTRINVVLMKDLSGPSSFPSLCTGNENVKGTSALIHCKFGSLDAVAKVRKLEVYGTSKDEIRNFEFNCLGEVRMLSALKHPCIVEIYGHQISCKWAPQLDGNPPCRILQSAILMEDIKGGSVKNYVEKLSRAGEKRVPVNLALWIAKDVACALVELHSKHIIHRDLKSENILIDLDRKSADGAPVVKLCDFDRAIPLRSYLHTCCIAHIGIPPPDICVGTPRWMAPEVLEAMHEPKMYGLEVDIWSFGCLLFELLTLQVPYSTIPELEIHDKLQKGKRPPLPDDLEALAHSSTEFEDPKMAGTGIVAEEQEATLESLGFLVDIYRRCTVVDPSDRPTAVKLYDMLLAHISSIGSRSLEQ